MSEKHVVHVVREENADRIAEWLRTRGGIAVWRSIDLSDLGKSWTTPVNNADGTPKSKPSWQADNQPERIITDPDEVVVSTDVEVKRFHVAIRMGAQGLTMKLKDGSSRRVKLAVERAGSGAFHIFDYDTQEAVIMQPSKQVSLTEYMKGKANG